MTAREAGAGTKRRAVAALALVAAVVTTPALAQPTGTAAPQEGPATPTGAQSTSEAQRKAEAHYKRARELYGSGAYREAAAELEAAHALDPKAKELVFNLGVVSEKLGQIDDALRYFRLYASMGGVTEQEKQKADALIRRLEGAKREVPPPPPTPSATAKAPPPSPPPPPEKPAEKGRIDGATIVAASIAAVGLGVGTTFGLKALGDKPKSSFVTGRDGTYDELERKTNTSHREAIVADVGFGVGVVAAAVAAYLYFGRSKATPTPRASLSGSPLPGGGTVVVQGTF